MQFINNGPDIPERLLQAHEEGQVIFFCGAGISYPAGLPGFSGLVNKIYEELSIEPTAVQKLAIKAKQFDTAISLIESDVTDGREKVRSALSTILKPNLSTHKSTATHEAILDLSKNRNGLTRLITTNFDRIFEEIKNKKAIPIPTFKSPFLPIPKIQWNGIIYLHGLLPENYSKDELNNLIISSGDFGLAYLTDRWAARFISTLFRNYTICFVGYSINDPVLRYMMDALAADRLMGESSPEMFAFGSYSKGKKEDSENEWKAKNVTPILYKEYRHHFYLHKTLHEWAKVYRSGASGKELIVTETALFQPVESTKQDNYINRMLWALSDPSGLPAKRFAELEPVPELSWLEKLNKKSYRHENLTMFGVSPKHEVDRETTFWFFDRPTPYYLAPSMSITATTHQPGKFDKVMRQMALWLARHLNDPKLILWLINQGPFIHPEFRKIIENQIEKLDALSKSNDNEKIEELARIKKYAPNAIPNQAMKIIWRLLLDRQVKFHNEEISIFRWIEQFKIDGMTTSTRLALRETIKPCVSLNRPLVWDNNKENKTPERIAEIVKWEIVLASDHVRYALDKLSDDINWKKSIPYLLGDFNMLLEDALNLSKLLGEANTKHDCTYIYQPSISNHIQNKGHQDCVMTQ